MRTAAITPILREVGNTNGLVTVLESEYLIATMNKTEERDRVTFPSRQPSWFMIVYATICDYAVYPT